MVAENILSDRRVAAAMDAHRAATTDKCNVCGEAGALVRGRCVICRVNVGETGSGEDVAEGTAAGHPQAAGPEPSPLRAHADHLLIADGLPLATTDHVLRENGLGHILNALPEWPLDGTNRLWAAITVRRAFQRVTRQRFELRDPLPRTADGFLTDEIRARLLEQVALRKGARAPSGPVPRYTKEGAGGRS